MSSKWNEQFGAGAILESTDGATYNEIKPIIDPKAPKENEIIPLNVPSLAEQLAARKAEEDEEYREMHRNQPPKALDEDEAFFLEAIQREELIKEDLKRQQQEEDVQSFNKALQNRVIKLNDNDSNRKIIPIDRQINKETETLSSNNIVIAPSVRNNSNKPNVNLDGIVLLKKRKKRKKKKNRKNTKDKGKEKKENVTVTNKKKRKLDGSIEENDDSRKRRKLSEWERD